MTKCKSPTHKAYRDAIVDADISAAMIAREFIEARGSDVAVIAAMDMAAERIEWARKRLAAASEKVNAHIDRGCSGLMWTTNPFATREFPAT